MNTKRITTRNIKRERYNIDALRTIKELLQETLQGTLQGTLKRALEGTLNEAIEQ